MSTFVRLERPQSWDIYVNPEHVVSVEEGLAVNTTYIRLRSDGLPIVVTGDVANVLAGLEGSR